MKLAHITVHTNKAKETIEFYKTYAGLDIIRAFGNITFIGDNAEGTLIEIIADENVQYNGSGLSIGFACDGLEEKRDELIRGGFAPTDFISPNPMVKFFFVNDPSGLTVQFIAQ